MNVPALAKLYEDPDLSSAARCSKDVWSGSFEKVIDDAGMIGHITTRIALNEQLNLLEDDSPPRYAAACLINCLPVDLVLNSYGEETMAWAIGNDKNRSRVEKVLATLDSTGHDGKLFGRARQLCLMEGLSPSGQDILAQRKVMKTILDGILGQVETPGLLTRFAKAGVTLSPSRLSDYSFISLQSDSMGSSIDGRVFEWHGQEEVEKPGLYYSIWLDTPVGYALTYKGIPQAFLGVTARGSNELIVRQVQGIRGVVFDTESGTVQGYKSSRGLAPLDWQSLLIGSAAQVANFIGMDSVAIRAGHKIPSRVCKLSNDRAAQVYDDTARSLGFELDEDGDWHRQVKSFVSETGV